MTEQTSKSDWFEHFHRAATTELELIVKEDVEAMFEAAHRQGAARTLPDVAQVELMHKSRTTLDKILSGMKEGGPDPASVFEKGLAALADIDRERFLIENLLEAVKRGESFAKTLDTYRGLNLTDLTLPQKAEEQADEAANLPSSSVGAGELLWLFLKKLKKVATKIIQIIINAMKASPKFLGIKPSVGFSGPFPSLSFQFELEAESVTLHALFQDLTEGLSGSTAR